MIKFIQDWKYHIFDVTIQYVGSGRASLCMDNVNVYVCWLFVHVEASKMKHTNYETMYEAIAHRYCDF